jgi:predicted Zn-dependent protease
MGLARLIYIGRVTLGQRRLIHMLAHTYYLIHCANLSIVHTTISYIQTVDLNL